MVGGGGGVKNDINKAGKDESFTVKKKKGVWMGGKSPLTLLKADLKTRLLCQTVEQTVLLFFFFFFAHLFFFLPPNPQPSPNLPQISNCFHLWPCQINRIYWIRLISRLRPRTWQLLWPLSPSSGGGGGRGESPSLPS